jgi:hypothetical protein
MLTRAQKLELVRAKAARLGLPNAIDVSDSQGKKFVVLVAGKRVHFGQLGAEDFWDHRDPERRRRYLLRARAIRDGRGRLTRDRKSSANFWSIRLLW